jgi:hypothetical protein
MVFPVWRHLVSFILLPSPCFYSFSLRVLGYALAFDMGFCRVRHRMFARIISGRFKKGRGWRGWRQLAEGDMVRINADKLCFQKQNNGLQIRPFFYNREVFRQRMNLR